VAFRFAQISGGSREADGWKAGSTRTRSPTNRAWPALWHQTWRGPVAARVPSTSTPDARHGWASRSFGRRASSGGRRHPVSAGTCRRGARAGCSFTDEAEVIGRLLRHAVPDRLITGRRVYTQPAAARCRKRIGSPRFYADRWKERRPCTVAVGGVSNGPADRAGSISCAVTYRWSAPSGTLAQPPSAFHALDGGRAGRAGQVFRSRLRSPARSGQQDGVLDQRSASRSRRRAAEKAATSSRESTSTSNSYSLRPASDRRVLDRRQIAAMARRPRTLKLEVEGHTCNQIGNRPNTTLALGDRGATS